MENASSNMTSAARSFMDARKWVALVILAREFFPVVGVAMTPRACAGYPQRRKDFSVKLSWSREKQKQKQTCFQTEQELQLNLISREIVQIADHVTNITHISNVLLAVLLGMVRAQPNTSCRSECGWKELINFCSLWACWACFLVTVSLQLASSSPCKSCFEKAAQPVHRPLNKHRLHNGTPY